MIEEGKTAPAFSLSNQNNEIINLSDFKGKYVVLYFYPKAMTPGCTTETCNFEQMLPDFKTVDAVILGASKDSIARQKKFADKHNVHFDLLSDENETLCEDYGVWQQKKIYGREFMGIVRSTFIIDSNGLIAKVYHKVKVAEHHVEVLQDLKELQK